MAGPRYTEEELLNLRQSPLVPGKPDRLPSIKQWCEPDRKPREQTTDRSSRGDENDQPVKQQPKRPGLFERQSSRQQPGEEIFLGPKISFASARQPGRSEEESRTNNLTDDSKPRYQGRDRGLKEREGRERGRYERNGAGEGHATSDGRSYGGSRRTFEKSGEDEEDSATAEDLESRRRAKLDQPWIRGGRVESNTNEESLEPGVERGAWRDRERNRDRRSDRNEYHQQSSGRVEQDPQWMKEAPMQADITLKTEADFEAWKQAMKGNNAKDEQEMMAAESTISAELARKSTQPTIEQNKQDDFFNLWSEPKREEREPSISTPKTTSKPKSSRFAGFFGPAASEQVQKVQEPTRAPSPTPQPYVPAPVPSQALPLDFSGGKTTNEDQEGFQKVMQMLRSGNSSAQNQGTLPFALPPLTSPPITSQSQHQTRKPSIDTTQSQQQQFRQSSTSAARSSSAAQSISSQVNNQSMPGKQTQQPPHTEAQRPAPPVNRDSEFLLKLMQQPRVPFAEGQIYGQAYNSRKDPAEIASLLGNLSVGQRSQPGPPPGMQVEDHGYPQYQQMQARPKQPQQMPMDDRNMVMPTRQMAPQREEQRYQQQPPPGFDSRQQLPRNMMPNGVAPPPGFGPQGRGSQPQPSQMPQNFYQQRGMMPGQAGPPGYYPQGMPPNAGMPGLPPGFMPGPPPGMPPMQQGRRHPSLSMQQQPVFDMHGNIDVHPGQPPRGMQQQQQYQQYMK